MWKWRSFRRARCGLESRRRGPTRPREFWRGLRRRRSKCARTRSVLRREKYFASWIPRARENRGRARRWAARKKFGSKCGVRDRRGARRFATAIPAAEKPDIRAPLPDSTRTTRAGVSGGTPPAAAASNGNTTQTRDSNSQDSLRCTRMPLRETSSVWVDSMRMPRGPRQRTRAGSFSWARGCLRNSRNLEAGLMSAHPSRSGGAGQISPRNLLLKAGGGLARRESYGNVRPASIGGRVKAIAQRPEAVIA